MAERTAAYQGVMQALIVAEEEAQRAAEEGEDPSGLVEPVGDYDDEGSDDDEDEEDLTEEGLLMASIPMEHL